MKAFIIYNRFYDFKEDKIYIGGIETYIHNLIEVIKEYTEDITVIQFASAYIEKKISEKVTVIGVPGEKKETLIKYAEKLKRNQDDLLIFASTALLANCKFENTIAIQHGIYWDMNYIHGIYNIPEIFSVLLRCLESIIEINRQKYCKKMVCVDYNYINWYRTQSTARKLDYIVIPNFVKEDIIAKEKKETDIVSIVYARRFEMTRGVDLICKVMPKLLSKYENVLFTIAGSGSQEAVLKEQFKEYKNVNFTTYVSDESIEFHKNFDIALVPSIGSEGTSLSLLEGMMAECAVVGTDVGGITNILLDGYNGIIVSPKEKELEKELQHLITDKKFREKIAKNGRKTAEQAFSHEKWTLKWKQCIEEVLYG